MSNADGARAKPAHSNTVTEAARQPPARSSSHRWAVALVLGSSDALSQELGELLRRRLCLAACITGIAFGLFFLRNLVFPDGAHNPVHLALLGAAAAVHLSVATLLFSRSPLTPVQLRVLEVGLFGLTAFYFGWLHMDVLNRETLRAIAQPDHYEAVVRMANRANLLRWFTLVVIYGTFIPNTWRRCALVVAALALTPVLLTTYMSFQCPYLGACLGQSLLDTVMVMGLASAVAIFGSYKISVLHREAYEARQLGQYRLKERLGAGGMGEVYLGEHMLLRRACAIKLIRPEQAGDPTVLQRFEREVRAMANLTHWNTAEVYDYGHAEDGTFYYVMEYLPGLSLHDLVAQVGPLPPGRAVHFLRQVCAALGEAHTIGMIHRDIKPSNVIACRRGGVADVAKLLDFGLVQCMGKACSDARLTVHGAILGSPPYMSPEQALGKDHLDSRTDIYSIGALGYYLLTGRTPFVRETAMQVLMAHVYEKVVPPSELRPDLPPDLEAVLLRCLEKDPAKRFQDVEELDEALAGCASAGQWTRQDAASWWREHDETDEAAAAKAAPPDAAAVPGSYLGVLPQDLRRDGVKAAGG
jgi:serine/threonine-protein kinase